MDPFDVRSPEDLDRNLRANDVCVPHRTQGRTTGHAETWVACRFLATIAGTDLLHFPVRVEPGDRPDLVSLPPTGRIGSSSPKPSQRTRQRSTRWSSAKALPIFGSSALPGLRPAPFSGRNQGTRSGRGTNTPTHGRRGGTRLDRGHAAHSRSQGRRVPQAGLRPTSNQLAARIRQLATGFLVGRTGRHRSALWEAIRKRLELSL